MLKLSIRDIKQGYIGLKRLAQKAAKQKNYGLVFQYINHCVVFAQQFNWIYADFELERLLKNIAIQLLPAPPKKYQVDDNKVVFFDDFCRSFVLALQYIDALTAAGKQILYITTKQNDAKQSGLILDKLSTYNNITIAQLSSKTVIEQLKEIQSLILDYHAAKVLLHIYAKSIVVPVLYRLPINVKSYIINLSDQTFWLGANAVDYVIEFRQFGVSVSQQRRAICPNQQLLIPFYPIIDNNPFQGFPKECTEEGKVLIFSGSDIYKVLDEKRMYWHLVKRLLDTFPEVVFLFATKKDNIGMKFLQSFIRENHYEGRFIYTKFRPDINEVLAHSDIYMGTCPSGGALMSQLAARNKIPILQYYYPETSDDATEQVICVNDKFQISFRDEDSFMSEAGKLIHDVEYRKKQGVRLQQAMISVEQFNEMVCKTLETNQTQIPLKPFKMDYQLLDNRWFALEKAGYISSMSYLYGLLTAKHCLRYAPMLFLKKNINTLLNKLH